MKEEIVIASRQFADDMYSADRAYARSRRDVFAATDYLFAARKRAVLRAAKVILRHMRGHLTSEAMYCRANVLASVRTNGAIPLPTWFLAAKHDH